MSIPNQKLPIIFPTYNYNILLALVVLLAGWYYFMEKVFNFKCVSKTAFHIFDVVLNIRFKSTA